MSNDAFKPKTMKRKNVRGLALAPPPAPAIPSATDAQIPGGLGNSEKTDTLEIGVEFRLDLRSEDLIVLKELGAGNGGTVSKVQHAATKVIMARKIIHVEAKKEVRRRIVRELQIMHETNSDNIISFFGAFMNDAGDVIMCMEYMDTGSLDYISKTYGPVRVDVLGKIAEAVLGGLTYLWKSHRIMHRDIKPSNVLANSKGQIKLCDFGVSGELVGSVADTFVGTGTYMAPERIQGAQYTVKSDVWSVGLTLHELAIGKFPFHSDADEPGGPQGILDLLQQIVHEPAPQLPESDAFPSILHDIIAKCLLKDPALRPTPEELFNEDPFIQASKRTPVDLVAWAASMMDSPPTEAQPAAAAPLPILQQTSTSSNSAGSASTTQTTVRTPTSDVDLQMQMLSLDANGAPGAPGSARPYPVRTSSQAGGASTGGYPPQNPVYASNQYVGQIPAQVTSAYPGQIPAQVSSPYHGQMQGQATSPYPGQLPARQPPPQQNLPHIPRQYGY